jgi:hypothetical protein
VGETGPSDPLWPRSVDRSGRRRHLTVLNPLCADAARWMNEKEGPPLTLTRSEY